MKTAMKGLGLLATMLCVLGAPLLADCPLADPAALAQRVAELASAIGEEVPRPEFWGAYRIVPESFEFWIGREDRLHERFVYRQQPDRSWNTGRLSP